MDKTERRNKRKLNDDTTNKDEYETNEKKRKSNKIEKKSINEKAEISLHIQNNVFIKKIKENKLQFEKIDNIENIYRKLKSSIISLNVSYIQMVHYDSFVFYEKNKIDFLLPELDTIINPSNIDVLKELHNLSFYPIYNETLSKRIIEWLIKDRNENKNKEYTENINMSYLFSLNILLTYLIYKNDDYSNYSCLIYLNILQWFQNEKKGLKFRLFILKGILKRFLFCSFYFNDNKLNKLKKTDNECELNEEELDILKNIFAALYNSLEYIDISNFVNINDKNCIFELIKFFIDLIKKPLIHSIHILCINYLIKIVKKCYDFRFTYNINVELYEIGPEVNIFVKIVNLIFAKILSILKDTKNEENLYSIEEINNINNLVILFFKNILNNCIRIIIPQVLLNDKLKHNYLLINEKKNNKEKKNKEEISFEDQIVLNACDPIFSFIEIFIINHCDKYEKNMFIDLIKILINECRKIEKKHNIMEIICDEFILFIKGDDNKKKEEKFLDKNYLKVRKISKKRIDSSLSFNLSDEYSSSVYSETEEEIDSDDADEEIECNEEEEKVENEEEKEIDTNELKKKVKENQNFVQQNRYENKEKEKGDTEENKKIWKKIKKTKFVNKIEHKRKCNLIIDNKKYLIIYESVMIRYLNILLKYMSCEKYQIRNIILDLFLALIKKKKTNKNESIFHNLFKLFLERLEDPNMIVKAKALSILVILTNRKYHDNSLIYNFIFNKTKEKINMYKIISSNVYSNRSNIRKLTIQYIEAIFETLINKNLNYKIFLIFISNYIYSLSLDAMSSVRRQVLLTVNNLFINASSNIYITKIWLTIIFSAITDIEETVKEEAICIFLNTFIKPSFNCSIFNVKEKKIIEVLKKNNLRYFKVSHHLYKKEENSLNNTNEFADNKFLVEVTEVSNNIKNVEINYNNEKNLTSNQLMCNHINNSNSINIMRKSSVKEKNKNIKNNKEEYDRNNDGILHLISTWELYFEKNINNYFLTLLKVMTKYDLLNFNLLIFCLKKKKNNTLEEFINLLNSFIYNLRYFSIRMWNTFILDFIIELSRHYQNKINIENILFLLNRCYKIYLMNVDLQDNIKNTSNFENNNEGENNTKNGNTNKKKEQLQKIELSSNMLLNYNFKDELLNDYILNKDDLIDERNICSDGILKNIMLKLFTIIYNLLDNINELNEEFLQKLEYIIFHFKCPLCFIYIILNILIKKKKNINNFIEKLKNKIIYFFENIESIPYNNVFCNILITFVFLINHFRKCDSFLSSVCEKLKKIYDNTRNNDINNIMIKNCIYLTQSVLLIDKGINIKNDLFSNLEKDLKNINTSMNVLNNLIILIYYMVINFGSSCNKFVFILLRFFKHENSFIRYLSFYIISKLISEDYIKFNNQFFFAFLYLLADKNELIRKQSLSVFKHILLIYNKTNLINYIIEFIFVLNNFYNFKLSKHLSNIGNSFEIKNKEDRYTIYCFLLENLTNSEKFSLQQKLINEYLIQYVYNYDNYYFSDDNLNEKKNLKSILPLNDEDNEGSVLQDVLNMLCSKLMKIKIKKDFAKLEEKNRNLKIKNVENSVKVLHDLMKNILKKNTLPILLSLRAIMLKSKSFFFKYINNLVIYLCLDYKDSLDDLIPETHVKNEITSDLQNFIYVDLIQLHTEQSGILNKNININFLEFSEKDIEDKNITENEQPYQKESSSDYDEVTNVLHGIHDNNRKSKKKGNKKKKKKKKHKKLR
ncbi:conserved Plasmodium protein, unknown function [Plasmodium gallinaceum]|uniref:Condensin-2 complex subunit D3 n=1 Tax=Plasmodium gallinaceum TaxID=5849 RepID=A0A1J1GYN5_PLAGA|nr:conserved Plasmodium protein, unknown function [Plasmodium gallinaceum]CRG96408.1 conserved Plasmodium protein, unknown function [Plasmodium gallinaceum]